MLSVKFDFSSTHISNDSNQLPSDSMQETIAQEKERESSAQFFIRVEKSSKKTKRSDEKIMANINISETSTYTLLDIPSICVSSEDPHAEIVLQNNQKYLEVSLYFILDKALLFFNMIEKISV